MTVLPGHDVVSDPVHLRFRALETIDVGLYVAQDVPAVTEHWLARQDSYVASPGSGNTIARTSATSFTAVTTTRPFVDGIDVLAPRQVGAVITLGDSITDGAQNEPNGVLQSSEGINANDRYPDWLARRLRAHRIPLSVMNAGIAGNKLLHDGAYGGNAAIYGASILHRLDQDAIDRAGVTTVILLSGINDAAQAPLASASQIIAGYKRTIARLHAAGLRVLQATLTPAQGYPPTAAVYRREEATREAVNRWIRRHSTADRVIDFDAAVRDPTDPTRIDPRYDDGDHLHYSAAGYRRLADTVPLGQLKLARCES